ncbi:lantibiotic dehydratase [Streptomyces sp. NPDC048324]|uniref:lantibiotic dehydratase n=1 Tax=Streptomyces sp. NPDC048324 TaxID=3157205 RepID=UPI00343F1DA7
MEQQSVYKAVNPITLRVATLQRDTFDEVFGGLRDNSLPTDAELADYIRTMAEFPNLVEAVAVSSPVLLRALEKVIDGDETRRKRLLGTATSITRYAIRMSSRSTPFGLYAGVAAAQIGTTARSSVGEHAKKIVRVDSGWFDSLSREWISSPHLKPTLEVILNNLCMVRGNRLVVPHVRIRRESTPTEGHMLSRETSMRLTPLLQWICERAHKPVRYSNLLSEAIARFMHVPEQKLETFLDDLLANDVLLSKVPITELNATSLADSERTIFLKASEAGALKELKQSIQAYAGTRIGQGKDAWSRLRAAVARVHDGEGADVSPQVDVRADVSVTLPHHVINEVENLATTLWRISPDGTAYAHMHRYRIAFFEKYGPYGVVRLKELINPHTGLGYPEGYLNPASTTSFRIEGNHKSSSADARAQVLGSLAYRGLSSCSREVVLTDADVNSLNSRLESLPSQAIEICFQLLADTLGAVDENDFSLWVTPTGGSLTAGAMAGRFSDVIGNSAELGQLLSAKNVDAIVAQVDFAPILPRAMNVVQARRLVDYSIPVGIFHESSGNSLIDWRDLVVGADGDALHLYWESTGQEVIPVIPHTLSLSTAAPNLVRFLAELRYANETRVWQPWEWGEMSSLPCLPRVRFGKSVIAPLTWKVSAELQRTSPKQIGWDAAVAEWRKSLNVDSRVRVMNQDQYCEIDLNNALHREIFRREVAQGNTLVTEVPGAVGKDYGWLQNLCNEFTVPLLPRNSSGQKPRRLDKAHIKNSEGFSYPPGSAWVYLELDCVPEIHDELIKRRLPQILQEAWDGIDRWFFIRYNKPRHHIRLRLRSNEPSTPAELSSRILQICASLREDGYISDFRLCAYEPEFSRFGGIEGVDLAERLFHADSEWVINLLRLGNGWNNFANDQLELASYGIILDGLGDWDWCEWVTEHFRQTGHDNQAPRSEIRQAGRIIEPGMTLKNLAQILPDSALISAQKLAAAAREVGEKLRPELTQPAGWTWRDEAIGSFLHLHHNRFIGISPDREKRSLASLYHISRMYQGRTRHGIIPSSLRGNS